MQVNVLERPHAPEEIVDFVEREVSGRLTTTTILGSLFNTERERSYESIYRIYFPLFVVEIEHEPSGGNGGGSSKELTLGVNGITESVGRAEELPAGENRRVDRAAVIRPVISDTDALSAAEEWFFKHFDRSYRSLRMPDYNLDVRRHHLLYWLIDRGSLEKSYAINDLTERYDPVSDRKGIDEYYRQSFGSDA